MTEPEPTERYRGPLPGEVPLSRDSRPGGALPGLAFDDVTGRVVRVDPEAGPPDEGRAASSVPSSAESEPASSSEPEPETSSSGPPPGHLPDRGTPRTQRRTDGRAMVPLLSRALSSQLTQLAADDDPVPDGWWFTPDR